MPELIKKAFGSKKRGKKREFVLSNKERLLLKRIGLRISKELSRQDKNPDWLAFHTGLARSAVQQIIAGRSNVKALSLNTIAVALNYKDFVHLLRDL